MPRTFRWPDRHVRRSRTAPTRSPCAASVNARLPIDKSASECSSPKTRVMASHVRSWICRAPEKSPCALSVGPKLYIDLSVSGCSSQNAHHSLKHTLLEGSRGRVVTPFAKCLGQVIHRGQRPRMIFAQQAPSPQACARGATAWSPCAPSVAATLFMAVRVSRCAPPSRRVLTSSTCSWRQRALAHYTPCRNEGRSRCDECLDGRVQPLCIVKMPWPFLDSAQVK